MLSLAGLSEAASLLVCEGGKKGVAVKGGQTGHISREEIIFSAEDRGGKKGVGEGLLRTLS